MSKYLVTLQKNREKWQDTSQVIAEFKNELPTEEEIKELRGYEDKEILGSVYEVPTYNIIFMQKLAE